jgi:hypothetical protein
MTDKELWEKSQVWESSDDGRGKLKILESVEKFAELVRADERDRATRENAYVLAEREACAKVCDEASDKALSLQSGRQDDLGSIILRHHAVAHQADAAAIRART